MRSNSELKIGNYYPGGPAVTRYYTYGIRIPRWLFSIIYGRLCP